MTTPRRLAAAAVGTYLLIRDDGFAGLIRPTRPTRPTRPDPPAAPYGVAYDALREWRVWAAARSSCPLWKVLSNAELAGIARSQPRTLAALSEHYGIGPVKLALYGDEILEVLSAAQHDVRWVPSFARTHTPFPSP